MPTQRRRQSKPGERAHNHRWAVLSYEVTPEGKRKPRGKTLYGCTVPGCVETKVEVT